MAREPSMRGLSGGKALNGAANGAGGRTGEGAGEGAGQRRVRAYSRLVSWMKVVLPLAAVAVMSAMFFSAQTTSDLTEIFTAEELVTLGAGLRLDNPRFAGVTEQGEPFTIRADWALPDGARPRFIDLERPEGEIQMADGRTIAAQAATGRMQRQQKTLVLEGGVVLDTSDGYHIETDQVEIDLDAKTAHGPGPVRGTGPSGQIEAGSFRIVAGKDTGKDTGKDGGGDEGGNRQIWFENRVRVVFSPAVGPEVGPAVETATVKE